MLLCTASFAGITDDVRGKLEQNNFSAADAELQTYRTQQGVTPDYVEALSWMARASLVSHQLDQRRELCQTNREAVSRQLLPKRPLDAEPHLPIALGRRS